MNRHRSNGVDAGWRRWPVEACLRWAVAGVDAGVEATGLEAETELGVGLGWDLEVGREPAAAMARAVVAARVLRLPM
jgi:hypothetical protein